MLLNYNTNVLLILLYINAQTGFKVLCEQHINHHHHRRRRRVHRIVAAAAAAAVTVYRCARRRWSINGQRRRNDNIFCHFNKSVCPHSVIIYRKKKY